MRGGSVFVSRCGSLLMSAEDDFIELYKSMENKKYLSIFSCVSSINGEIVFKLDKYVLKSINNEINK
jgi:hypothetical protein